MKKSSSSKALIPAKGKESLALLYCILGPRIYIAFMQEGAAVRIDKWLWAVRLYRSRSLATTACNAGHVKIGGQNVKPSREVRVGDVISALAGCVHRTVKVVGLLDQRVGARLVPSYLEDQTPPEEYARARQEAAEAAIHFPKGFGRPTKKLRRQLMGVLDLGDRP